MAAAASVVENEALVSFTGETGGDWTSRFTDAQTSGSIQLQAVTLATAGSISGGSLTKSAAGAWSIIGFVIKPV